MGEETDEYSLINFEETELRLGLPGALKDGVNINKSKRGFSETVDLKLSFSSTSENDDVSGSEKDGDGQVEIKKENKDGSPAAPAPRAKFLRSKLIELASDK